MPREQVFISYSHKDKRWRDDLDTNLKPYLRSGSIVSWSDQQIAPGSKWFGEIKSALAQTKVAVLLVTPDFLASDFIDEHELGPLLKEAEQGGVNVLWVPIYASSYKQTPLKNYQAVLDPDKPLASMTKAKRDQAWVRICEEIEKAVHRPPGPITFTVIPLGHAYIPETQHTVSSANIAQRAFKFEFRAETVPIDEDGLTPKNWTIEKCSSAQVKGAERNEEEI
jgi:hypothetical protein